ncbi:Choline transporter-like protein 1 [Frankliniella fusca]|uniref:Choline transporter-like protein n=1 Tax=Frankliniella fusca TaxID=407009 RepID=A0AAE1HRW4_9NEOP|nr:Choline transporter-like protein 1 [Frankliniella fusca]
MGACFSSDERVEPAAAAAAGSPESTEMEEGGGGRKGSAGKFHGPVKNRSCTDVIFLILFGAFVIVLIGLLGYCMYHGDIYRIINGYDNCGNVCGRKNKPSTNTTARYSCTGADRTNEKFLLITGAGRAIVNPKYVERECVRSCDARPGYRKFLNRCIPETSETVVNSFFSKTGIKDFLQEVSEDLHLCWQEILYLCLIAFALSIVLLFLFRFVVAFVVWIVLIGVVIVSIFGTIYLWVRYKMVRDELKSKPDYSQSDISQRKHYSLLAYAIIATVATVVIMLVVLVMRKRIQLVVQLFREAGKAVANMPILLFQPILTFACLAVVVALWLHFTLWIETSGFLTPTSDTNLYYKKDTTTKVTRWYNLFALFWFTQFIVSCQHMVIAGAVSAWFFTRNKDHLDAPLSNSFYNLVRYHLGSVAFGSLLIAIVQMARAVLAWIQARLKGSDNDISKCLFRTCQCCLYCFEKILKYLTRNAFIEISMYGHNFCRAGEQAFKMLASNALRVAAINSVGDFVLWLGKALVVIATVLIGVELLQTKEGIQHAWVPLGLAGLFAFLVSHCFLTVYEMVIDTIFLCFCEDCEQNDGLSKPYYMSKDLMEFVEDSKKKLAIGDARD